MRPFALKTRRHKCFPRPEISGSCVTNTIFRVDLKSLCGAGARVRRDSRRRRDPQSKRLDADAFRPALRVRARRGAATPPPRPTRSLTTLPAALPVCSSPRGPVPARRLCTPRGGGHPVRSRFKISRLFSSHFSTFGPVLKPRTGVGKTTRGFRPERERA